LPTTVGSDTTAGKLAALGSGKIDRDGIWRGEFTRLEGVEKWQENFRLKKQEI